MITESVWVFNAPKANFSSGVFRSPDEAEPWIAKFRLTGVLTEYPVGTGVLDWTMAMGYFTPKPEKLSDPEFVGRFSSASMKHIHYRDGVRAG